MKKLTLLLAALLVLAALLPAIADSSENSVVPAESAEDFFGSWAACSAYVDPFMMTIDESRPFQGNPATLEIDENGIAMALSGSDYALTYDLNADGALEAVDGEGGSWVFQLNADGTVSLDLVINDTPVTLYYQQVTAD